ncbi:Serine/arginine-rich SC35-like splicing factor SCL30A-like protein [Drosera capensis]
MRSRSYSYSPSPSRSYRRRRSPSPRGGYHHGRESATSLLVRNLRRDCRPEDLRGPFGRFGPIKDIYLPRDYYSGEPRGFGFVQFVDPVDAADAKYEMNGYVLLGRELTVVFAEENRKKPSEMRARQRSRGLTSERRYSRDRYSSRSPRRGRSYSRSPRCGRSYSRSPDYHSPRCRHYSRSFSPRDRSRPYDRRSYSRSPYQSHDRKSYSRSPYASPYGSRSWSASPHEKRGRSRSLEYSR